jgi:hypothetical protein
MCSSCHWATPGPLAVNGTAASAALVAMQCCCRPGSTQVRAPGAGQKPPSVAPAKGADVRTAISRMVTNALLGHLVMDCRSAIWQEAISCGCPTLVHHGLAPACRPLFTCLTTISCRNAEPQGATRSVLDGWWALLNLPPIRAAVCPVAEPCLAAPATAVLSTRCTPPCTGRAPCTAHCAPCAMQVRCARFALHCPLCIIIKQLAHTSTFQNAHHGTQQAPDPWHGCNHGAATGAASCHRMSAAADRSAQW